MSNAITIRRPPGAMSLADNEQWTERFEIRSESSGRIYIVAQNKKTGQWGCSCPAYRRARNGIRQCKHLTQGCNLSLAEIHGNGLTDQRPKRKAIG